MIKLQHKVTLNIQLSLVSEICIKRQLNKKYREVAPVKYSFNSKFHQIAPLRLQIEQIRQYYADYSNKMCDITGVGTKMLLPLQISANLLKSPP